MTGQTILVADPDAGTATLVRRIAEPQGLKVEAAANGLEALAFSLEAAPALVLADLDMPRMGGLELIRALRQRYPKLPVILLATNAGDDAVVQCLQAGAVDVLRKPLALPRLEAALREALTQGQAGAVELRYEKSGWLELTADSAYETVARFRTCVERLTETNVDPAMAEELRFAIEELGRNAVEWGNRGAKGKHVHLSYCLFADKIMFKIEDEGEGFNPSGVPDPTREPELALKSRTEQGKRAGGFGIHLVRKLMDEVIYSEKGNTVIMTKHLAPGAKR